MKTQHTSGTWFVSGFTEIVSMPSQCKIAKVSGWTFDEAEANAKLIAAAPAMLEALEEALDQLESWRQESEDTFTMKRVKEALKKATGNNY